VWPKEGAVSLSEDIKSTTNLIALLLDERPLSDELRASLVDLVNFGRAHHSSTLGSNPAFAAAFVSGVMETLTALLKDPKSHWTVYLHPSIAVMCAKIVETLAPEASDTALSKEFTANRPRPKKEDLN
jgi:hypothetical protein